MLVMAAHSTVSGAQVAGISYQSPRRGARGVWRRLRLWAVSASRMADAEQNPDFWEPSYVSPKVLLAMEIRSDSFNRIHESRFNADAGRDSCDIGGASLSESERDTEAESRTRS